MRPTILKVESFLRRRKDARLLGPVHHVVGRVRHHKERITAQPLSESPSLILKILLWGTVLLTGTFFFLLLVSFFVLKNDYVLGRLLLTGVVLGSLFLARSYIQKGQLRVASYMIIGFYVVLATVILSQWSINAPVGILLLGFVIVLVGVTLGSRYIPFAALGAVMLLTILQLAVSAGLAHPDRSSLALEPGFGDVATYSIIFLIVSLVAWLSRKQMEQSLAQARQAEVVIIHEKEQLAIRLKEQTRILKEAQIEETKQLYRFAELGQLSTLLLHELANHLTVLTLDMEDLQQRHHRSKEITRARQSIGYLETMVSQVRYQLQDGDEPAPFAIMVAVRGVISGLNQKAKDAKISLRLKANKEHLANVRVMGDEMRLGQIVAIIITNAIDASSAQDDKKRRQIEVTMSASDTNVEIAVTDWGEGITPSQRKQVFEPFHTTKQDGMGIGLFVAKKTIETYFKGTITIGDWTDRTTFIISLPRYEEDLP